MSLHQHRALSGYLLFDNYQIRIRLLPHGHSSVHAAHVNISLAGTARDSNPSLACQLEIWSVNQADTQQPLELLFDEDINVARAL